MKKAFIFDMDGVLIDSERAWMKYESNFLEKVMGKAISEKIGDTTGVSVETIYKRAKTAGFKMRLEEYRDIVNEVAFTVYDKAMITPHIDELVNFLILNDFQLGLVSASSKSWIDKVLPRLSFRNKLTVLSLEERPKLNHKPSPDGYIEMMRMLSATPKSTIILEDSNFGIQAGIKSGAFTIALSQNLIQGYKQKKADANCKTIKDVLKIIKKRKDLLSIS